MSVDHRITAVRFTDYGILKTVTAEHANSVADAINEAYQWTLNAQDSSCTVMYWHAMNLVLSQMQPNGLVFVFHGSVPLEGPTVLIPYITNVYDYVYAKKIQVSSASNINLLCDVDICSSAAKKSLDELRTRQF